MMKEEILKIIDTYIPEFSGMVKRYLRSRIGKIRMAEEIDTLTHEHYFKFIEWFQLGLHHFGRVEHIQELLYVNFNEGSKKKYTLEEVYQYWLTQIK
jgi:hypothetical protein